MQHIKRHQRKYFGFIYIYIYYTIICIVMLQIKVAKYIYHVYTCILTNYSNICAYINMYRSYSHTDVGVHGIRITHAGREEVRMLAFNRYDLEEWIEVLRKSCGTPSTSYKRGWGIDPIHKTLSNNTHAAMQWEVQGPGVLSTIAGVETTIAITPPKIILHRLDATCLMVTITDEEGCLYELIVREANEGKYIIRIGYYHQHYRSIHSI